MEFVIFVWFITSLIFLIYGCLTFVLKNINIVYIRYNLLYVIGLCALIAVSALYIPKSTILWNSMNSIVYGFVMQNTGIYKDTLMEVWYTIVFFRNMWIAVFAALLVCAVDYIQRPISSKYRMIKQFSHNKLLVLVGSLFMYFAAKHINHGSTSFFLVTALYSAVFYWRFGTCIILYILKKSNVPYWLGLSLMLAAIIVSGEHFFLPLVMSVGFGISDIWMDYFHRDSAASVFSFEYH